MATRTLGPSSGGAGEAYVSAGGSGRYNTGDTFSISTDTYYFGHSPLQRMTVTVTKANALSVSVPTGARAVIIQTPIGTTDNISVTTSSANRYWYIGPDGLFLSTIPTGVTTIYLQSTTDDVNDVTIVFI